MTIGYIRYLAATDDYPTGALALEYLRGLLRIARVRVGSMTGGFSGKWEAYSQLLITPMRGDFVNIVCCDPSRWTWEQKVPMPKRLANGELVLADEVANGWQELYTQGVHNVLMTSEHFEHRVSPRQRVAAMRYEQLVVPDETAKSTWLHHRWISDHRCDRVCHIPVPLTADSIDALRAACFPTTARQK